MPHAQFCFGFGLAPVSKQEKHLLFVRKSKSCLSLVQESWEPEFQLSIGKENLTRNVSQLNLHRPIGESKTRPIFWTAQCLQSRSPRSVYREALRLRGAWNLNQTQQQDVCGVFEKPKLNGLWRKFKRITVPKRNNANAPAVLHTCGDEPCATQVTKTNAPEDKTFDAEIDKLQEKDFWRQIEFPTFPTPSSLSSIQNSFRVARHKIPTHQEAALFRIHHDINISDCDIQQVAQQLTLIEASLLSAITAREVIILANEKSTAHTPHVQHMEAFSVRLSCLVTSEIVNTRESVQIRAKIMAKFILIAEACSKLHNYQSTSSILHGLQSPPVFR